MLKKKPANEYHQMLLYYMGKNELQQNIIDFQSARKILMEVDKKMLERKRFERIYKMTEH